MTANRGEGWGGWGGGLLLHCGLVSLQIVAGGRLKSVTQNEAKSIPHFLPDYVSKQCEQFQTQCLQEYKFTAVVGTV
jgi:hypothetical protein